MNWVNCDFINYCEFNEKHPAYKKMCWLMVQQPPPHGKTEWPKPELWPYMGYFDGSVWQVWDEYEFDYRPMRGVMHYMIIEDPDGKTEDVR